MICRLSADLLQMFQEICSRLKTGLLVSYGKSSGVPQPGVAQAPSSVNHTAPVKNRLGFPRKFSDTLELKRIPRDLNNIAKLNEHFQRFGAITNIQVEELCGILDNNFKELTTVLLH